MRKLLIFAALVSCPSVETENCFYYDPEWKVCCGKGLSLHVYQSNDVQYYECTKRSEENEGQN